MLVPLAYLAHFVQYLSTTKKDSMHKKDISTATDVAEFTQQHSPMYLVCYEEEHKRCYLQCASSHEALVCAQELCAEQHQDIWIYQLWHKKLA